MLRHLPLLLALSLFTTARADAADERPPNVVIVFLDDSGWGDFQPFGSPKYKTPQCRHARDAKAVASTISMYPRRVCSASRSALLSGCYPGRTKMFGAHGPNARGLDPKYRHAWAKCSRRPATRPPSSANGTSATNQQPDRRRAASTSRAGLMYSNDMWEFHPGNPKHSGESFPLKYLGERQGYQRACHQSSTSRFSPLGTPSMRSTLSSVVRTSRSFCTFPHSMPHVPLFVSKKFAGKSGARDSMAT